MAHVYADSWLTYIKEEGAAAEQAPKRPCAGHCVVAVLGLRCRMQRQVSIALVTLSWVLSALVYSRLPERIATHYDLAGSPDRWDSRLIGAFIIPLVMLITFALARWQPSSGVTGENARARESQGDTLRDLVLTSLLAFFALMHLGIIGAALGWRITLPELLPLGLGALFLMFGHVLPRLEQGGLVGIRTRSTMSSERTWKRTHRVAGAIMTAAGTVMIGAGLFDGQRAMEVVIVAAVLSALATAGYVYQTRS